MRVVYLKDDFLYFFFIFIIDVGLILYKDKMKVYILILKECRRYEIMEFYFINFEINVKDWNVNLV